ALAVKAGDEAAQLKQAAESGTAELQKSLQQEREREEQLAQDLATAQRDVEPQTELADKAGGEANQLKQAAESGTAEMQKEREHAARLEQDLSAARTRIYAFEAQASKAGDEAAQLKQATESGTAELRRSLQQQR